MLSNHFWSASNVFLESRPASLNAWACNAQRAAEKLTELNLAAAKALAAESRDAVQQCLRADSPQAWLTLALTQAQAHVAKAQSYRRHLRAILFSMHGDELADMKMAAQKLSMLADKAAKKLHVAPGPALTLSDSAKAALALTSGRALSDVNLASFDMTDVTDVTDVIDVTEFTEISTVPAGSAKLPVEDAGNG